MVDTAFFHLARQQSSLMNHSVVGTISSRKLPEFSDATQKIFEKTVCFLIVVLAILDSGRTLHALQISSKRISNRVSLENEFVDKIATSAYRTLS
jgi:hypothetical protein